MIRLHAHLKKYPSSVLALSASSDKKPAVQKTRTNIAAKPCGSVQAEAITNLQIGWATSTMHSLSILSDTGLQILLQHLETGSTIPSTTDTLGAVAKRHQKGKSEPCMLLKSIPAAAATTDAWTSKAVRSFPTYTVYFKNL